MNRGNTIDVDQIKDADKQGAGLLAMWSGSSFTAGNVPAFASDGSLIDSGGTGGSGGGAYFTIECNGVVLFSTSTISVNGTFLS